MSQDERRFDLGASVRTALEDARPVLGFFSLIVAFSIFFPTIEGNNLAALMVGGAWAVAFALLIGYLVWRAHRKWRRVGERIEHERIAELAGVRLDDVEVSRSARMRHALRRLTEPALGASALVGVFGIVTMGWGNVEAGLRVTLLGFSTIAATTFLWALIDAFRASSFTRDAARAEAAYREAVREGADLEGALSAPIEAREGGELSVSAQAGAFGIHEEVALELDAEEEAHAEAHHEVAAKR